MWNLLQAAGELKEQPTQWSKGDPTAIMEPSKPAQVGKAWIGLLSHFLRKRWENWNLGIGFQNFINPVSGRGVGLSAKNPVGSILKYGVCIFRSGLGGEIRQEAGEPPIEAATPCNLVEIRVFEGGAGWMGVGIQCVISLNQPAKRS